MPAVCYKKSNWYLYWICTQWLTLTDNSKTIFKLLQQQVLLQSSTNKGIMSWV